MAIWRSRKAAEVLAASKRVPALGIGTTPHARPFQCIARVATCPVVAMRVPTAQMSDAEAAETLVRPQLGLHRLDWPDDECTDFRLPHSEMIALLRTEVDEIRQKF